MKGTLCINGGSRSEKYKTDTVKGQQIELKVDFLTIRVNSFDVMLCTVHRLGSTTAGKAAYKNCSLLFPIMRSATIIIYCEINIQCPGSVSFLLNQTWRTSSRTKCSFNGHLTYLIFTVCGLCLVTHHHYVLA